jgi:hypothetical protein
MGAACHSTVILKVPDRGADIPNAASIPRQTPPGVELAERDREQARAQNHETGRG